MENPIFDTRALDLEEKLGNLRNIPPPSEKVDPTKNFKRLVLAPLKSYSIFNTTVSFLVKFCVRLVGHLGL